MLDRIIGSIIGVLLGYFLVELVSYLINIVKRKRKEREKQMRKNLQIARKEMGLTQQQLADRLGIGIRQYQRIESGDSCGKFEIWDDLEDIIGIHQRILRDTSTSCPDTADSQ